MKVFSITVISLAFALALGGAFLATGDYTATKTDTQLEYSFSWGTRSFDKTVWLAVDEMARLDDTLPQEITAFHVAIESESDDMPIVYLDFDRASLVELKQGELAPEDFIRDHIDFN